MIRESEIASPTSCLNKAADDEPIFVLRANDELANGIVWEWASRYFKAKSAQPGGITEKQRAKYQEALALADQMLEWRESRRNERA